MKDRVKTYSEIDPLKRTLSGQGGTDLGDGGLLGAEIQKAKRGGIIAHPSGNHPRQALKGRNTMAFPTKSYPNK